MADFNVRSDSINVEQIMEQIRSRIRDKRGVDYTEQQIRDLAAVKLEKFLDPRGVRSDMLEEFRRMRPPSDPPVRPNYVFDDSTLFETHRAPIRWIRRLLRPILKLFFNPNPLIQALHIQSRLNTLQAEAEAQQQARGPARDQLTFEVMHNLVLETTRMGIEVKNLKMRIESLASRLEFNERRSRALESAVVYKPAAVDQAQAEARGQTQPPDRDLRTSSTAAAGRPDFVPARPAEVRPAPPEATRAPSASSFSSSSPSIPSPSPSSSPSSSPGGQPVGPEGPGQRSRRRRRRRGRRGGAPAAVTAVTMGASGSPPGQPTEQGPAGDATERPAAAPAPASEPPPVAGSGSSGADPDAQ